MATWLLTCNRDVFDLDAFRRDGQELQSWSVARYRSQLTTSDGFVMWLTGPTGGLVGHGHFTGVPTQQRSTPDRYWQEDPGVRWYVPLEIDEWLDIPVPRVKFVNDPRFDGTNTLRTLFAGNPHRLNEAQWETFSEHFGPVRTGIAPTWHLQPGDTILRKNLHTRYGGSREGDISPSAKTPNVLIFTDSRTGNQHGHFDEWAEDGTFHYTGAGQKSALGFMNPDNAAIRDHVETGKALRVFEGFLGEIRYVGEFAIDPEAPYTLGHAHETGGGPMHQVIRFHLLPVGEQTQPPQVPVGCEYRPADDEITPAPGTAGTPDPDLVKRNLRAHRRLQNDLATAASAQGLSVLSPSAADPDFDLAWRTSAGVLTVCEVKSLTRVNEAHQLRMGIGQVLDYQHLLSNRAQTVRAVLWVEREPIDPRWIGLCQRHSILLAWPGREADVLLEIP